MVQLDKEDVQGILERYGRKLDPGAISGEFTQSNQEFSREYETFREEALEGDITFYEKWCNRAEKIIQIKPKPEKILVLQESIDKVHLRITPIGAASFAVLLGMCFALTGILIGAITIFLGEFGLFFPLFLVFFGAGIIRPVMNLPNYFAARYRLEAGSQMVLCVLYVVMYMRHTSNLEHAIKFAAQHLGGALSLDFKKVFWDVETGNKLTIKESLDSYLTEWKKYNLEFVEAFHLIEGSLYEPSETRRIELLEKSLQVILEGNYNNMLHYAHNLRSPITILHMLGIILPILGLVIFPLVGSFMKGAVRWYHLFMLYNVLLPILVMGFGYHILLKRPSGYGGVDISKINPELRKEPQVNLFGVNVSSKFFGFFIAFVFILIGFLPVITHALQPGYDVEFFGQKFLDYKDDFGPYGFWAGLMSLLIPFGLALGVGLHCRAKTKNVMEIADKIDKLDQEFAGSLFQLGNRIADGIPAEISFSKVAETMQGTPTGNFFRDVSINIRKLGMGIKEAIFNKERGAIMEYPSSLIETSMKVLIESARKGPQVVAKSLITVSSYVDRIRQVDERLKDLLAEVISSMKSQVTFLTPVIAGIVVGVGSMVVNIINKLQERFADIGGVGGEATGVFSNVAAIMNIKDVIPTFYFQFVVGLYVVQITIILIVLSTYIERGVDRLSAGYGVGKLLIPATGLYIAVSLIGMILFNFLANAVSNVAG
ncbi:hypothetical protein HYT58_00010 [Candidatus Woesearchaeota archaeon]|nr:hypothetical protein [Candidatus Woesearchaeota archaeon]